MIVAIRILRTTLILKGKMMDATQKVIKNQFMPIMIGTPPNCAPKVSG